jgi:hypothetical protein
MCATILAGALSATIPAPHGSNSALLLAQSASSQSGSADLDAFLFVQAPERDFAGHPIDVVWLPQPLQKFCLGKTASQCAIIDFCIRTTNRESSQCSNIGVNLASIPKYPPDTRPRRMQSVTLMYLTPDKFKQLQDFYKSAPKASLQRFSMSARIKARIRYTWRPDDDTFQLLDVLAVSPF